MVYLSPPKAKGWARGSARALVGCYVVSLAFVPRYSYSRGVSRIDRSRSHWEVSVFSARDWLSPPSDGLQCASFWDWKGERFSSLWEARSFYRQTLAFLSGEMFA